MFKTEQIYLGTDKLIKGQEMATNQYIRITVPHTPWFRNAEPHSGFKPKQTNNL